MHMQTVHNQIHRQRKYDDEPRCAQYRLFGIHLFINSRSGPLDASTAKRNSAGGNAEVLRHQIADHHHDDNDPRKPEQRDIAQRGRRLRKYLWHLAPALLIFDHPPEKASDTAMVAPMAAIPGSSIFEA